MHNYKLLSALDALLKTKNLTDAALTLNVTQSAMSKTLGQLREAFHDQLLIRQGNQFVLTQRAEQLRLELPPLLRQLNQLYSPNDIVPKKIKRQFVISYNAYVAPTILPQICHHLETHSPDSSIVCQLWQTEKLEILASESIDLVVAMANEIPENIYGKLMGKDQYVIVMRKDNPLAKKTVTLEDYGNAKHILVTGVIDKRREVDELLAPIKKTRQIFAQVPSFLSAMQSLSQTNAIMTAPAHIVSQYLTKHELVIKPFPVDLPKHSYYLLWHAKYQNDQEHRWFRDLCFPLLQEQLTAEIQKGRENVSE